MVNLNHGVLHLGVLPNCHVSMEIKIKHRYYVLDIDKNKSYASIRFSKRPLKSGNESRKVKKKNGVNDEVDEAGNGNTPITVIVNGNADLDIDFFEHIEEIKQAQLVYQKYSHILNLWN